MKSVPPFHLAFPVNNIEATRRFYVDILQCKVGRESDRWIDFNFFCHQITAHLDETVVDAMGQNPVDGKSIPARHFGAVLSWDQWDVLVSRLDQLGVSYYIEPNTRFVGEIGEQRTFFIQDPSGNYLEFKCFRDSSSIFEKE